MSELPGAASDSSQSDESAYAARLDVWRADGAAQIDQVGFLRIENLVRRAEAYQGETRRVLDRRIEILMQRFVAQLEQRAASNPAETYRADLIAASASAPAEASIGTANSSTDPLVALLAQMLVQHAAHAGEHPSSDYPRLPLLDEFRATWKTLSARRRLHDARGQVPKNAGPLNSSGLVHRALTIMQELSPDYLRSFLDYAETLAGLEQLDSLGGRERPQDKETARPATPARKSASRGKSS